MAFWRGYIGDNLRCHQENYPTACLRLAAYHPRQRQGPPPGPLRLFMETYHDQDQNLGRTCCPGPHRVRLRRAAKAVWRSICRREAGTGCQGRRTDGPQVYKATTPDLAADRQEAAGWAALRQRPRVRAERAANALQRRPCRRWRPNRRAAVGTKDDKASTPVARGLPRTWDEIAPGHLVIAQESGSVTGGGRPSSSAATTTCSRCGFATTRGYPSSFATAARSR